MKHTMTQRIRLFSALGIAAAVVLLTMPASPPAWQDALDELTAWRNAEIRSNSGPAKHAVGHKFYYMTRLFGSPVNNVEQAHLDALLEVESRLNKGMDKASMANEWKPVGPGNYAGRIRAIAFNPDDYSIVYAGGASGGVFKSTNGGMNGSWTPMMDFAPAIPVGAIVVDPDNPDIVYAGTGEPIRDSYRYNSAPIYGGVGIMKSTDAGATWNLLPWPTETSEVYKMAIDPRNTDIVMAATRGGLYRTEDGGQNWSRPQPGIITDVVQKPDNPDIIFAAMGNDAGTRINGVYMSTNGGANFSRSKLDSNWPEGDSIGRIDLAVSAAAPDLLMAFLVKSEKAYEGDERDFFCVMRSSDAGQNWERITSLPQSLTSGQGHYDLCAAISPTDPDVVLVGGIEVYRSRNRGTTWTAVTRGNTPVHVDQHVMEFTPDGKYMYLGNDGGVYRTENNGSSFELEMGRTLETIQFYTLAWDPNDEDRFYGGAQDHGIFQTIDTDNREWNLPRGGDGGYVLVDPTNSNVIYSRVAVEGAGQEVPWRSTNRGSTWTRLDQGFGALGRDRFNWLIPMMLAPNDNTRMYTATQYMYTAKNVHTGNPTWMPIGDEDLTTGRSGGFSVISTFDVSESDPSVMYIGCGDGHVQVCDNILSLDPEWVPITEELPERWVTRVRIDPRNSDIAYLTYSGFGGGHVYKTTNRGQEWIDISGDLPDIPVNSIAISKDRPDDALFIATDLGVWYTRNSGATWTRFGTDLPNVVVYDIDIDDQNRLIAATFGRGMWITDAVLSAGRIDAAPQEFAVMRNYPNPARAAGTTLEFALDRSSEITVTLHDAAGRRLRTLAEGRHDAGTHQLRVRTADLLPGVYFTTITDGVRSSTRKMVVMR